MKRDIVHSQELSTGACPGAALSGEVTNAQCFHFYEAVLQMAMGQNPKRTQSNHEIGKSEKSSPAAPVTRVVHIV